MTIHQEAPATRKTAEVETVHMADGRKVEFAGKRKVLKSVEETADGVMARFDFRNGQTRTFEVTSDHPLLWDFVGHGVLQKIGDETAGEEDPDDMVVAVDAMIERLSGPDPKWAATRASGGGFAGAHIVIRAIMEATGKDQATVKGFIESKLAATGLSRQALYASFRAPGTKTAPIIERMEKEKTSKKPAVDADSLLEEV